MAAVAKAVGKFWVSRGIFDSKIFHDNRDACVFFMWLIAEAQWKNRVIEWNGQTVLLNRSQAWITIRGAAAHFKCDKGKVERWIKYLEREGCISRSTLRHATRKNETLGTLITICNYEKYQAATKDAETPPRENRDDHNKRKKIRNTPTARRIAEPIPFTPRPRQGAPGVDVQPQPCNTGSMKSLPHPHVPTSSLHNVTSPPRRTPAQQGIPRRQTAQIADSEKRDKRAINAIPKTAEVSGGAPDSSAAIANLPGNPTAPVGPHEAAFYDWCLSRQRAKSDPSYVPPHELADFERRFGCKPFWMEARA